MHKLVTLLAAAALLAVCLAPAAPQTSDQATVAVNLTIEKYVSINIEEDTLGMTVTADQFENDYAEKEVASSLVLVSVNFAAEIKAPKHVPLSDVSNGETYTADADISLTGSNPGNGDENYWYLPLDPGVYNGTDGDHITLQASVEENWNCGIPPDDPVDPAGTYTGIVTLEIYPQP